ncbi:prepilin-type cleavage/methylation domain-containing protein [Ahniella affigens]|uniref:Prepilin-type cleavage/methylation domain-containing protein n=1 Tax=Ahniella affigens TaxID=2021234 RepID=A0A2P1PW86_9GAMM|nr:pilin [Ahniella affigens]AVP99121.1 prepilin-type cleavage/methylation domain-containing protein [Ahniella affigens]
MKKTQGFTLIELMIVVAIIAILAAIALPAYQDYTIRAQVSECPTLAAGAKTAVAETFQNTGTFPTSNTEAGMAAATEIVGNYVTQVEVSGAGVITCTFGNDANTLIAGQNMTLTPDGTTNVGSITWQCGGSIDAKYRPSSCRP